MRYIGAHVSASGGVEHTPQRAHSIGANCMQIFGGSPVRWSAPLPSQETIQKFQEERKQWGIKKVFMHAPYLINLASPKEKLQVLSRELLLKHGKIADALGVDGVIFHIGSRGDMEQEKAHVIIIKALEKVLQHTKDTYIIMENTAGAGNLVGDTLEELVSLYRTIDDPRLGICIDTAHAFASGMIQEYSTKELDTFFSEVKKSVGIDTIKAIHLNDSKTEAGSRKDRHENIGEGKMGKERIQRFVQRKEIKDIPLILEVPGFDNTGPDKRNIEIVTSYL